MTRGYLFLLGQAQKDEWFLTDAGRARLVIAKKRG